MMPRPDAIARREALTVSSGPCSRSEVAALSWGRLASLVCCFANDQKQDSIGVKSCSPERCM